MASFHFALLLPIGSANTEALARRNFPWVLRTLRKTVGHTLLIFAAERVFGVLLGDWVISLWAGKWIPTPSLFFWLGVWALIYGRSTCFLVFLNDTGHLE